VDTSGIYALLDRSDANHGPAVALLRRLKDEGHGVVVTNFVVAETHALVRRRGSPAPPPVHRGWSGKRSARPTLPFLLARFL